MRPPTRTLAWLIALLLLLGQVGGWLHELSHVRDDAARVQVRATSAVHADMAQHSRLAVLGIVSSSPDLHVPAKDDVPDAEAVPDGHCALCGTLAGLALGLCLVFAVLFAASASRRVAPLFSAPRLHSAARTLHPIRGPPART